MIPVYTANAGAAAAAAAAAAKRRADEEEEQMTEYRSDDLDGWEFKILRSATGIFKDRDKLQAALAEESQNGWELVEKFDDQRLRMKRRMDKRSMDSMSEIDPYRTWTGTTPNQMAARIVVGLVVVLAIGGFLAALFAHQ